MSFSSRSERVGLLFSYDSTTAFSASLFRPPGSVVLRPVCCMCMSSSFPTVLISGRLSTLSVGGSLTLLRSLLSPSPALSHAHRHRVTLPLLMCVYHARTLPLALCLSSLSLALRSSLLYPLVSSPIPSPFYSSISHSPLYAFLLLPTRGVDLAPTPPRRFMRRPNVGEALQQFRALTSALQRDGESSGGAAAAAAPYAAFCSLAVARCEQAMQRNVPEAEALLDAGQWQDSTAWSSVERR